RRGELYAVRGAGPGGVRARVPLAGRARRQPPGPARLQVPGHGTAPGRRAGPAGAVRRRLPRAGPRPPAGGGLAQRLADGGAGGGLSACAIDQSQVGHAHHFLMREVAAERGFNLGKLHNNWEGTGEPNTLCGVYLCDFDRDGILDVLVTDVNGTWLYKGLPGGKFRDVTDEMGLFWAPRPAYFAAFVDLDGDG